MIMIICQLIDSLLYVNQLGWHPPAILIHSKHLAMLLWRFEGQKRSCMPGNMGHFGISKCSERNKQSELFPLSVRICQNYKVHKFIRWTLHRISLGETTGINHRYINTESTADVWCLAPFQDCEHDGVLRIWCLAELGKFYGKSQLWRYGSVFFLSICGSMNKEKWPKTKRHSS